MHSHVHQHATVHHHAPSCNSSIRRVVAAAVCALPAELPPMSRVYTRASYRLAALARPFLTALAKFFNRVVFTQANLKTIIIQLTYPRSTNVPDVCGGSCGFMNSMTRGSNRNLIAPIRYDSKRLVYSEMLLNPPSVVPQIMPAEFNEHVT